MALTPIPQLQELTNIDENTLLFVDSGIQSYKMTAPNLARGLLFLGRPSPSEAKTTSYNLVVTDAFGIIKLDSSGGSFEIQLPNPALFANRTVTFKDVGGALSSNPVQLTRFANEEIGGMAANYQLEADFGSWNLWTDGVDWFLI